MLDLDVDDIQEVTYQPNSVRVVLKNGEVRVYEGANLQEALSILNHWTPPTA
ncbi:MAG TPA: hypothetical protein VFA04_24410 [Bryobacteraceae bacterium]|nr:hypothetical protein [Bryobacteraceae bacterium]